MLSRRDTLLWGMGGLATSWVAGCGLVPPAPITPVDPRTASPTPTRANRTAYTATQEQADRLRSLRETIAASGATRAAWKATPGQAAALAWALGVVDEQLAAVGVPVPGEPARPSSPVPAARVQRQLVADAGHYRGEATRAAAPSAALWAGIAAWCRVASLAVVAGDVAVQRSGTAELPASAAPLDAGNDALEACHQVIYGLPVAMATPGWSAPDRAALARRLERWTTLRDAVSDAVSALPGIPIAAQPYYRVTPPPHAAAARTEVGRLQLAALPHLAVAIDSGPARLRATLVTFLGDTTVDLTRWRAPIPRWPGLS